MAKSPLRRNRTFERFALPILAVLLVVVLGRQLRAATSSDRCDTRVERIVHIDRHAHDHDFDFDHDVDVTVDDRRIEIRIES